MIIPKSVNLILSELHRHGFEAYAVGGCVRDMLLGREPEDWDITTSAEPPEIKEIFPVTIDTGIEHGTVTVRMDGANYEVTTFRTDGEYRDHRRPEEVHFTKSLKEDLLRRDFTINAMAWDGGLSDSESGESAPAGIIDLYGGQQDLADGIIRCVGDPDERFEEDALRILRAFRFAAKLTKPEPGDGEGEQENAAGQMFTIDPATRSAVTAHREELRYISAERIQMEMTKIITSEHPEVLRDMYELGVTEVILPEFDRMMETPQNFRFHFLDVGEHTILAMRNIPPETHLRWTMLLHDTGKPQCRVTDENGEDHFRGHPAVGAEIARDVMNRMKMDNATKDKVIRLVRCHDDRMPAEKRTVRRAIARIGTDLFEDYCRVRRADVLAQSKYRFDEKMANLDGIEELYRQIMEERECVTLAALAVGGEDLIAAGLKPGPQIGKALRQMLDWVIEEPSLNDRETLMARWSAEKDHGEKSDEER